MIFVLYSLLSCPYAAADFGIIDGTAGGNARLGETQAITMENEQITVDLFKDNNYYYRAHVSVHYTFKNRSEQHLSVETGFPELESTFGKLTNFRALVDGKDSATKEVKGTLGQEGALWKVTTIEFAPQQQREVISAYDNVWLPGYEGSRGHGQLFTYILETGNSWEGSIKRVDVQVNLRNIDVHEIQSLGGALWKYNKRTNSFSLSVNDLEPQKSDNLRIMFDEKMKNNWLACNDRPQTKDDLLQERYSTASSSMEAIGTGSSLINFGSCSAFDGDRNTSWVSGEPFTSSGIGTLTLEKPLGGFLESFSIRTGRKDPFQDASDVTYFARPKKIRVDVYRDSHKEHTKPLMTVWSDIPDTPQVHTFSFPRKILLTNSPKIVTTVLEVYPGTGAQNIAIAELEFYRLPRGIYVEKVE